MKMKNTDIKNNRTTKELKDIYDLPFNDLLWKAQTVHRKYHNPNEIQILNRNLNANSIQQSESCNVMKCAI